MIHSGCDSLVSRFSFAVVILVQSQQQRTTPQPTSQQPRHSHHDATFDTFPTTIFATSRPTNAILHAPRGHDLRGTGEGSGVAAAKAPAGAWKDISRLFLLPIFSRARIPAQFPQEHGRSEREKPPPAAMPGLRPTIFSTRDHGLSLSLSFSLSLSLTCR